ncbi:hypothetical protein SAMN06265353_1714 [Hydrogenobacter hydrogenophilus]|uniref:Uncharacterized protein n=2 Tax=Hydrogenobacter hydrogenophilus TaxID=35835 RepID=A0A285P4Z5_9AQUI|nr:hypothetical protein SAMN06265353_1714 [Hydrogenobacter hydrogenophilus]
MGLYDRDYMRKDWDKKGKEGHRILSAISELFDKLSDKFPVNDPIKPKSVPSYTPSKPLLYLIFSLMFLSFVLLLYILLSSL